MAADLADTPVSRPAHWCRQGTDGIFPGVRNAVPTPSDIAREEENMTDQSHGDGQPAASATGELQRAVALLPRIHSKAARTLRKRLLAEVARTSLLDDVALNDHEVVDVFRLIHGFSPCFLDIIRFGLARKVGYSAAGCSIR